ncbi:MAG: tetratricopeptide repeat protein [Intrasporangiaceae bacterium]|nr:tetratricopeptide repeat protein [Intrasporangiaceae bacterium]
MTTPTTDPVTAREVRVLEGPNLYFRKPAIKVVLDVTPLVSAAPEDLAARARSLGWSARPGRPGTQARQRYAARLTERLLRLLARRVGTNRLGIRSRAGEHIDEIVVAFVWRRRGPARTVGASLPELLTTFLDGGDVEAVLDDVAARVLAAPAGEGPAMRTPRIPVISITGTNGKTTTTRMLAHISMTAGNRTAWSSTDGVVVQGELVEPGDYSGPAGARGVLDAPGVQIGILETARGGMLLKGMGVRTNDVSVVTNVAEDHLGTQGIHTVDQLAEVKAIVTKVTSPKGWTVLNGEDPRVWAMRHGSPARAWVFTLDAEAPAVREALDSGGRATTVLDGWVSVLAPGQPPQRLVRLADIPATMAGLARHNVANALAAVSGALALGIAEDAVCDGLRTFRSDADLNPGRLNTFSVPVGEGGRATVILDMAHNEEGVLALLEVTHGLLAPGARVLASVGMPGDRTDSQLDSVAEIAGSRADVVAIAHKDKYLRGRSREDLEEHLRAGLGRVGVVPVGVFDTEVESVRALIERAADGDVIPVMCHSQRQELYAWLTDAGGTPDSPDTIRAKVLAARGEHEAEDEIAALWALEDDAARIAAGEALGERFPEDARVLYERGGTFDAAGREEDAVPLYEAALAAGLKEPFRHRCRVQLASSLRNLGRLEDALAHLDAAVQSHPDSLGIAAFHALARHDAGESTGALRDLLLTIARTSADPDVERYRRAIRAYAETLEAPS